MNPSLLSGAMNLKVILEPKNHASKRETHKLYALSDYLKLARAVFSRRILDDKYISVLLDTTSIVR